MSDCGNCTECQFDGTNIPPDVHEIHITVRTNRVDRFTRWCNDNGVKPIVIETRNSQQEIAKDVMTSQPFKGSMDDALRTMFKIKADLIRGGFDVVREKIESSPTNPIAKTKIGYFECHLAFRIPKIDMVDFSRYLKRWPELHQSRNPFKSEREFITTMVTYRDYNRSAEEVHTLVEMYKRQCAVAGFATSRTIMEYCWLDSNVAHDDEWLKS